MIRRKKTLIFSSCTYNVNSLPQVRSISKFLEKSWSISKKSDLVKPRKIRAESELLKDFHAICSVLLEVIQRWSALHACENTNKFKVNYIPECGECFSDYPDGFPTAFRASVVWHYWLQSVRHVVQHLLGRHPSVYGFERSRKVHCCCVPLEVSMTNSLKPHPKISLPYLER